jgi:hypothetical protein
VAFPGPIAAHASNRAGGGDLASIESRDRVVDDLEQPPRATARRTSTRVTWASYRASGSVKVKLAPAEDDLAQIFPPWASMIPEAM